MSFKLAPPTSFFYIILYRYTLMPTICDTRYLGCPLFIIFSLILHLSLQSFYEMRIGLIPKQSMSVADFAKEMDE